MRWKGFTLGLVWFCFTVLLILLFSTQDKEWLIDGSNIKNICEVMIFMENDDIRDAGRIITLPLFFPLVYLLVWKKKRHGFLWLLLLCVFAFWLWRFYLRYTLCW